MALTDILEKIKKESSIKLDSLKKEFEEKKKTLEEESSKQQKQFEEDTKASIETDSAKLNEKAILEAEMEAKNELLKAKRELIDGALEQAVEKLSNADNYEEMLSQMLSKLDVEGSAQIIPARGKEDITRRALEKAGKSYSLSQEPADIAGGFILKTDVLEIDNSFETIINQQMRQNLEIELNKLMFA